MTNYTFISSFWIYSIPTIVSIHLTGLINPIRGILSLFLRICLPTSSTKSMGFQTWPLSSLEH